MADDWRKKRAALGFCARCGHAPPITNQRLCDPCRIKERRRHHRRQELLFIMGRCRSCPSDVDNGRKHCSPCLEKIKKRCSFNNKKVRNKLLEMYGYECACCGETEPIFLTIDHINNDGHLERLNSKMGLTSSMYRRILAKKRDDIQILCYNCNCGKARAGECPHETKRKTPLEKVI